MAYLGSVPAPIPTNFQQVNAQSFNGNGSTVAFTLSRPVQYTKDIEVLVNNVQQNPYSGSYSVSGTTLTFTEAPSSGSSNIYVIYRDHPLTSISPADASVTTIKIADGAVTPEKIAEGAALPSQTGQSGKYLTTDGTNATWETIVTAPTPANVSDQENTSTGFFDLPAGTTAQRPVSPTTGMTRFNTSTGRAEVYDGNIWAEFGAPPPSINTVTPTTYNGEQGTSFTINGANFTSDATVYFIDNGGTEYLAATVSYLSASQLTATTPRDFTVAEEPLDVKVIQSSGVITKLDVIDCGGLPAWTTASGLITTLEENDSPSVTVEATDPDSGATISYSLTSGALPTGLTIDNETGVISGTTPSVDALTTYNFGLRATDNAGNTADRNFSLAVNLADQYSKETVLLLNGDGTNGAQNNTFLDSSTNNFTITRNGNTTQGTFSPFSAPDGKWSNYFDGSGDFLNLNGGSSLTLDGVNFTIEAWVYIEKSQISQTLCNFQPHQTIAISLNRTGLGETYVYIGNGTDWLATPAINSNGVSNLSFGMWHHVALVRNSSTITLYHNGTVAGTSNILPSGMNGNLYVGAAYVGSPSEYLKANISNFRVVKGTAVYTSTFTPPTAPLTAISGTSLLTCQTNRFKDNSTNNFAITVNGNTSVQPFSPFAPSAAYDPSVNGGSGYFDGTGDYLVTASTSSFFELTGDFTVEFWYYRGATDSTERGLLGLQTSEGTAGLRISDADNGKLWAILISGAGTLHLSLQSASSNTIKAFSWNHIAVTRSGSTVRAFVNGVLDTSGTSSSWTGTSIFAMVGSARNYGNGNIFNSIGSITDVRVIKGSALYTSSFTPPTAPLTNITNTSLLLNYTNAGIFDATAKNNLETVGNAQIDTTTKKYGTGSMEFDGTGDYLVTPVSPDNSFGTGNFTFEMWVYITAHTNTDGRPLANHTAWAANNWSLHSDHQSQNEKFSFWVNNYNASVAMLVSTTTVATGTWYHIAITRSGNDFKMFVNGTQEGSTVNSSASLDGAVNKPLYIGGGTVAGEALNGFIDDLRITKGVARYTANFTPPTRGLRIK